MSTVKREQGRDFESMINTRQDRGIFVTGGGVFSWDAVTSTLSWTDTINVYVASAGTHTVAAGSSVGSLTGSGKCARISINRTTPGSATVFVDDINNSVFASDDALALAIRGSDDRLYFRDGTVFNHGESKPLGTAEQQTDRASSVSDGRAYTVPYPVGKDVSQATGPFTCTIDGTGLILTSSGAPNFQTTIPNTLGEPDSLTRVRISGDGIYEVASVDSNTQLTLESAATPAGPGIAYEAYVDCFDYIVGSGQLFVAVAGAVKIESVDYDENGSAGSTSKQIDFLNTKAPAASDDIEFINLSGGQGPQGDAGVVSLLDAYLAGGKITGTSGTPAVLDFPNGSDVVLRVEQAAVQKAFIQANGLGVFSELRVDDGAGQYWRFFGSGGDLRIVQSGSGNGITVDSTGKFAPYTGGAPDWMTWSEYSGTFGTPATAVTIATGVTTGAKGALLLLENQSSGVFYVTEINAPVDANADAFVYYDASTGDITIDGDFAGGNLGTDFDGGDWVLIFFHG